MGDPFTIAAVAGAGLGLLKGAKQRRAAEEHNRYRSAAVRYSPWTGMSDPGALADQGGEIEGAISGGMQGMGIGQDLMKAGIGQKATRDVTPEPETQEVEMTGKAVDLPEEQLSPEEIDQGFETLPAVQEPPDYGLVGKVGDWLSGIAAPKAESSSQESESDVSEDDVNKEQGAYDEMLQEPVPKPYIPLKPKRMSPVRSVAGKKVMAAPMPTPQNDKSWNSLLRRR